MESIVVRSLPPNVVLSHAHLGALFGQRPVPQVRGSGIPHASATKSVKVVNVASGKSISVGVFGPSSSGTTTRVQLSGTALRRIGLEAPTRLSRSLKGSGSCKLVGPLGEVVLSEGVIRPWRSASMSTKLASKFGLKHNDNVALKVTCPRNSVTFCTVKAQVEDQHAGEVVTCVLDSDEAGACLLADATQFDLYAMQGKIDNSFTFVHLCTTSAIGKVNPARVDTWAREVMSREFKQNYPSSSPVVDVTDVSTTGGNKESSVSFSDEKEFKLNVDVSNRHVHVSPEALEKLYGKNYSLEPYKPIAYLPEWLAKLAAFSAKETVTIKNTETNNEIRNVRILGPPRARSQIELAFTDCQILGIEAPTRISGDNVNSSPIVLIAEDLSSGKPTTRRLNLGTGALRAWRHIHADEDEADRLGFQAGDVLTLAVKSKGSTTLFHDVLARVGGDGDGVEKPGFSLWKLAKPYLMAAAGVYLKWVGRPGLIIHLDTDEGNACFLSDAEYFTLYKQLNDGKGGLKFLGSTKNMAKMPDRRQKMWQEEVKYRANL